jgi:hypothetical protein
LKSIAFLLQYFYVISLAAAFFRERIILIEGDYPRALAPQIAAVEVDADALETVLSEA